jgi:hypothetical protein
MSLAMSEELAGASFGQLHKVLDFQVVIELGLLLGWERSRLLTLDEIPDALARGLGRFEVKHVARAQRGDELNEFFVRSHGRNSTPARRDGKSPTDRAALKSG